MLALYLLIWKTVSTNLECILGKVLRELRHGETELSGLSEVHMNGGQAFSSGELA